MELKQAHQPIVTDLSFSLNHQQTLAIVGESGCGKTMLALSIIGLLPLNVVAIQQGKIIFNGSNILDLPENKKNRLRGREIGMIFQDPSNSLNPYLTIESQMREIAPPGSCQKTLVAALDDVGIPHAQARMRSYPHELSGGLCQRVMVAMCLLQSPKLLIADEPTTALDPTNQAQILSLLLEKQKATGMAMLWITHDLAVAAAVAHQVLILHEARCIEYGDTHTIFAHPQMHYTQQLIAHMPQLP